MKVACQLQPWGSMMPWRSKEGKGLSFLSEASGFIKKGE